MERREAIERLNNLVGQELHELAKKYGVTVTGPNGRANKGWAGHVIERYLGLPQNSAQSPNFGSWELKSIPLIVQPNGEFKIKETMAITMIDPYNVARTSFEDSHLLAKLKKFVLVTRTVGEKYQDPSYINSIISVDLEGKLYQIIKRDYEEIQSCIIDPARGFSKLTGKMGTYIQPRTKGAGHGSTSRAFYARKDFLKEIIHI